MQFPILKTAIVGLALCVSGAVVIADEEHQLRHKANVLQKEAAELSEKGEKDKAEKLERLSRELLERAERQEVDGRKTEVKKEGADARHNPDIQHLKERLVDMIAAQRKAKESGAEQEFKEISEQIAQTERKLAQLASQHGGEPGRHREVPEQFRAQVEKLEMAARRMHHVRVAAENLKAAEMHDMAQELTQRAAAMEQEIHAAKAALAEQMNAERKDEAHDRKGEAGEGEAGEGEVRELRSQNERLRAELNELREAVERLKNKQERE